MSFGQRKRNHTQPRKNARPCFNCSVAKIRCLPSEGISESCLACRKRDRPCHPYVHPKVRKKALEAALSTSPQSAVLSTRDVDTTAQSRPYSFSVFPVLASSPDRDAIGAALMQTPISLEQSHQAQSHSYQDKEQVSSYETYYGAVNGGRHRRLSEQGGSAWGLEYIADSRTAHELAPHSHHDADHSALSHDMFHDFNPAQLNSSNRQTFCPLQEYGGVSFGQSFEPSQSMSQCDGAHFAWPTIAD